MASNARENEMLAFFEFLGNRLQDGIGHLTPEDSVREFRCYEQELQQFIDETQPSIEESKRGESRPLDVPALVNRVRARLAAEGISD